MRGGGETPVRVRARRPVLPHLLLLRLQRGRQNLSGQRPQEGLELKKII